MKGVKSRVVKVSLRNGAVMEATVPAGAPAPMNTLSLMTTLKALSEAACSTRIHVTEHPKHSRHDTSAKHKGHRESLHCALGTALVGLG